MADQERLRETVLQRAVEGGVVRAGEVVERVVVIGDQHIANIVTRRSHKYGE